MPDGLGTYRRACGCREFCGDVSEDEDRAFEAPFPICKGLKRMPAPPLVELVIVHRDDLPRDETGRIA